LGDSKIKKILTNPSLKAERAKLVIYSLIFNLFFRSQCTRNIYLPKYEAPKQRILPHKSDPGKLTFRLPEFKLIQPIKQRKIPTTWWEKSIDLWASRGRVPTSLAEHRLGATIAAPQLDQQLHDEQFHAQSTHISYV
jgi:hypothetical protein